MHRLLAILGAAFVAVGPVAAERASEPASDQDLQRQRDAFREAYAAAELGDWQPAAEHAGVLGNYVLWPDLRAAWLRAALPSTDADDVQAFLTRYGTLRAARELRYHFALSLAEAGRWPEFLEIYRSFYQGREIARLDCLAVNAEILAGNGGRIAERAAALWLVGYSQADECDPVFEYMRGAGLLTEALYRERFERALSGRQYSLARYLARSLDEDALQEAERWLAVYRDPVAFLESRPAGPVGAGQRDRVTAAIERIALTDAALADEYWQRLREERALPAAERDLMARHIALWYARQHDADALQRLDTLPGSVVDDEVRRWRVRASLANRDWVTVVASIDAMPAGQRAEQEWRYWHAVALRERGDPESARARNKKNPN